MQNIVDNLNRDVRYQQNFKRGYVIIIDNSQRSLLQMIYCTIFLPAMKHPDEWTISKLRLNKCLHKDLLMIETHKLR